MDFENISGLPPLNFQIPEILNNNNETIPSADSKTSNSSSFNLINAVNDEFDKLRGPRLIDDIYLRLDDVSADDLLLEKGMITKFLISRYKNEVETVLRKPRDLMFAIIECICTGLKLYLTTQQGDCCYIDDIEIYNADIFCSSNDWILGFIGEKIINDDFEKIINQNVNDQTDVDKINIFDDPVDTDPILDLVSSWKRLKSDKQNLPPLVCYFIDGMYDTDDETNDSKSDKILKEAQYLENKKIKKDIENLKESYINLNVNMISNESEKDNCCFPSTANKVPQKKINILKLIIDMKELERLLIFLMYVDRHSLYNGIDIFIQNKSATSQSFCLYKKSRLSNDVEGVCLKNANSDRLKTIYDNITKNVNANSDGGGTNINGNHNADQHREIRSNNRILEIFEWITFLYLDKISTTIIESLFYKFPNTKINQSYKFGMLDLICPKIGKSVCNQVDTSKEIPLMNSYKRRANVSFDK